MTGDWQTMLEIEDPDPFYKLYSKVGIQNSNADVKLRRYLKDLDNERQVSEMSRNNAIFEEKVIAYQLKQNAETMKRGNTVDTLSGLSKRDSGTVSPEKTSRSRNENLRNSEESIFVSGYRLSSGDVKPRMFFWSQDASTKLPSPTAFYGYEQELKRPLTEEKLLGQDVYYGSKIRPTQSADPRTSRDTLSLPIRNVYTSGNPKFADGEKIPVLERAKSDIPVRTNTNHHAVNLAKTKHFAKIYDTKYETSKTSDPEELKLNLKRETGSQENLPGILTKTIPKPSNLWVGDPKAIDSVRRPRRRIAEMLLNFKTREEARRCYREMLLRTPCSRNCQVPKIVTELEKTYNEIPMLVSEINRLKTDVERDPTLDGKQYTKSTFGSHMQNSISRKVLNKKMLPVAFRKTNNTLLKHYGESVMENSSPRHYNTPDIFIETI